MDQLHSTNCRVGKTFSDQESDQDHSSHHRVAKKKTWNICLARSREIWTQGRPTNFFAPLLYWSFNLRPKYYSKRHYLIMFFNMGQPRPLFVYFLFSHKVEWNSDRTDPSWPLYPLDHHCPLSINCLVMINPMATHTSNSGGGGGRIWHCLLASKQHRYPNQCQRTRSSQPVSIQE